MPNRFKKIGADGATLADDAAEWVAVLDIATGLTWSVEEPKRMNWEKAAAWAKGLTVARASDWRLPTVEELFLLADRTRHSPAIDTTFFPKCKSDWYWTSTPAAYSPADYAWIVDFNDGSSGWDDRSSDCFVRAVRSSQ